MQLPKKQRATQQLARKLHVSLLASAAAAATVSSRREGLRPVGLPACSPGKYPTKRNLTVNLPKRSGKYRDSQVCWEVADFGHPRVSGHRPRLLVKMTCGCVAMQTTARHLESSCANSYHSSVGTASQYSNWTCSPSTNSQWHRDKRPV